MREQENRCLLVERFGLVCIGILGSGNEARAGHSSPAHPSLFGPDITSRLARTSRSSSELHCHYHFSGSRERGVSPLTRYTHRSLRQAPTYLAHTSTVSLSPLDISRVLNQYRLQSSQITKLPNGTAPFDSSNSEVM